MKIKVHHILPLIAATVGMALLPSSLYANGSPFTATTTGNWNLGATWGNTGNTPGVTYPSNTTDSAEISGGVTVTIASTAAACGNLTVDNGGTLKTTINGSCLTINGSLTNNGAYTFNNGQSVVVNYAGVGAYFAGSGVISNQTANFETGSIYTIVPGTVFLTGAENTGSSHLQGTGALTNQGTILNLSTAAPTITTLDCSTPGNTFVWTNVNTTLTPPGIAYYNIILGNTGSSGANLSAVPSIAGNLTEVNVGGIASWPASGAIGGVLTYSASSGTVYNFPATFSVGGFVQTSGKLNVPAAAVLTVTGSGANAWALNGGTLTQNATSTVKFTGGAPDIGGTVASAFANLIIDSTATNADATETFTVATNFTVNAGGSLNVTALTTYTMQSKESFFSSGSITGNVASAANSKVYAGGDGTYGTSTVSGNLDLSAGGTVNLDVDSTASGANDHIVVGGTLTLSSTVFNLKAPSAGATIDTATYTLVTAGSITGTPTLNWVVAPANVGNYSLATTGTTITLLSSSGPPPPPNSPTLTNSVSAGVLTLGWDTTDFPGFVLQSQTNSAGPVKGNWSDVSGGNVSPFTIAIDPAQPPVYFRLTNTP